MTASDCGVPDCGTRRCPICDERLMCTGPEPAPNTCPDHADECADCHADNRCRLCAVERMHARATAAWDHAAQPQPYADPLRDVWVDMAAERRQEQRAYELACLEDREEAS